VAKKKKKQQPKPSRDVNTRSYFRERYAAIQRMLRAYDLDPALLEAFNRKQLELLFAPIVESPRVKAREGHHVPRQSIEFIYDYAQFAMRTYCHGDTEIGFTYLDMVTHGMAFTVALQVEMTRKTFPSGPAKVVAELYKTFNSDRVPNDLQELSILIHRAMLMISKLNFRVYGFEWKMLDFPVQRTIHVKMLILILSDEAETTRFVHNYNERLAYRVKVGQLVTVPPMGATLERSRLTGDPADENEKLDVFIQSHAMQRVKERLDVFAPPHRNGYITEAVMYSRRVVKGRTFMYECYAGVQTDDMDESVEVVLGYFPFVVQDNKVFVLSFLPPTAPGTPAGDILEQELGLQVADMKYLGMDKLGFYLTVDFSKVPALKEVIDKTNIASLVTHLQFIADAPAEVDQKLTRLAERFFEYRPENALPVM
jgi:hypothetical protein